jgi:hypothetical protein
MLTGQDDHRVADAQKSFAAMSQARRAGACEPNAAASSRRMALIPVDSLTTFKEDPGPLFKHEDAAGGPSPLPPKPSPLLFRGDDDGAWRVEHIPHIRVHLPQRIREQRSRRYAEVMIHLHA